MKPVRRADVSASTRVCGTAEIGEPRVLLGAALYSDRLSRPYIGVESLSTVGWMGYAGGQGN